ncbi:MAG: glycoside hydrolase family 31 protein [Balneolaceae bacterium]|jgi:alpha-glucosidase
MPDSEIKKDLTEGAERKADVVNRRRPNRISSHRVDGNVLYFKSKNTITLRITVHTPEIIQFKYILEGDNPSDFSYAIDPGFKPGTVSFELKEQDSHFEISTDSLLCRIAKKDMKAVFLDQEENVLCKDKKPYFRKDSLMKGITEVRITKEAPADTTYYGLGDKITKEGLRGESFENWNTDSYAYELDDWRDPLYRSIPFYAALNNGQAYGIFMDNTYRSKFDFDSKRDDSLVFSAAGGCMNYYFIYGPELTTVTERYTQLTGTPEMPPLWALGYHQCRWSYFPESRVCEIADTFRKKNIPCDAIYLDIDYMDEYRCFTWDRERFPNPGEMISDLKEKGFKTVVMIDPGIKVDDNYFVYKEALEKDYFCKRPDGELMTGPVWPPKVAFPDYTDPEVREWWGQLYEAFIQQDGVGGVWNDMNEPAVFEVNSKTFPENIRHNFDGQPSSHKKAHNIYGMQMARASLSGIKKFNNGKRPFLLTRANFSGGQRYAALWTGDNIANWEHLRLANQQCQRLSISGYSFVGSDIGGFVEQPSAELFTRWLQLGIFHPLFRNHSMGYNVDGGAAVQKDAVELQKARADADQEPWTFGDQYTEINRSIIELRYRLLHYLYTAFWQYVNEGTPILRPLPYVDQSDLKAEEYTEEFLFGDNILVSPVVQRGKRKVETYFPEGRWYDFRTNHCYAGPKSCTIDAPLNEIPFFVKEGTVLPLRELMQYTRERDPEVLELNIYYAESNSETILYEDAEDGYDYKKGNYRLSSFRMVPDTEDKRLIIKKTQEGDWVPSYSNIKVNIIGLPFSCKTIRLDGYEVEVKTDQLSTGNVYKAHIDGDFNTLEVCG